MGIKIKAWNKFNNCFSNLNLIFFMPLLVFLEHRRCRVLSPATVALARLTVPPGQLNLKWQQVSV